MDTATAIEHSGGSKAQANFKPRCKSAPSWPSLISKTAQGELNPVNLKKLSSLELMSPDTVIIEINYLWNNLRRASNGKMRSWRAPGLVAETTMASRTEPWIRSYLGSSQAVAVIRLGTIFHVGN